MNEQVDEQVEAEKLRQVRALIEDLLREADVCGVVTLAGRAGRFESFYHWRASWSNLHFEQTPEGMQLRLRSKLADYNGDLSKQIQHQAWSVGVVSGFAASLFEQAFPLMQAAQRFDDLTGAEHTPFRKDDPRDAR